MDLTEITIYLLFQQLWRLYIARSCMDFCLHGTPETDWSSGLDWEKLFLERINTQRGNFLLLSFLSSTQKEGFQWNKKNGILYNCMICLCSRGNVVHCRKLICYWWTGDAGNKRCNLYLPLTLTHHSTSRSLWGEQYFYQNFSCHFVSL